MSIHDNPHILESGLWSQLPAKNPGRDAPAIFLDRDGVLVEEVHFLARPADVRLCEGVGVAIARANAASVPVISVTNQSGIARGLFGWDEFEKVQAEISSQLASTGARIDAVFACAYHKDGKPPFDVANHQWRKPSAGMFLHARDKLSIDLAASFVIGDRVSDLEAGWNAGLRGGILALTGYGRQHLDGLAELAPQWSKAGYTVMHMEQPADAIRTALRLIAGQ